MNNKGIWNLEDVFYLVMDDEQVYHVCEDPVLAESIAEDLYKPRSTIRIKAIKITRTYRFKNDIRHNALKKLTAEEIEVLGIKDV